MGRRSTVQQVGRVREASYLPGWPRPANSFSSDGVERLLSIAFRFLPMFEWRRTRFFQVLRVFEAIAGRFLAGPPPEVKHGSR